MKPRIVLTLCALSCFLHTAGAHAQWVVDGKLLSGALGTQTDPAAAPDGSGGAYVVWADNRSGDWDIFAHRVNAWGQVYWPVPQNGTPVRTGLNNHTDPQVINDGNGNAIFVWVNQNNNGATDIYANLFDGTGNFLWGPTGVALVQAQHDQFSPALISDGSGGAIVAWTDNRNNDNSQVDVYVRRVASGGGPQWTSDGVAIGTSTNAQTSPKLVSDGLGGAIIVWEDNRTDGITKDIYAQRVNSVGAVQWPANGVALVTASGNQENIAVTADGAGGAIVTWKDGRVADPHIYAQRINSAGVNQWNVDGVAVCAAVGGQLDPQIVPVGNGEVIVTWIDLRISTEADVYTQKLNSAGGALWTPNGNPVCSATGAQSFSRPVADGAGGAVVTWVDNRGGNTDIYAQRVNAAGVVQWTTNGVALCTAFNGQLDPAIVADGFGGAMVAWSDSRNGLADIYANRVSAGGGIPTDVAKTPAMSLEAGNNYPNPFASETAIEVTLVVETDVSVDVFDVAGRRVRAMNMGRLGAGATAVRFDGRDEHGRALPNGLYFLRIQAAGETVTRKLVIQR